MEIEDELVVAMPLQFTPSVPPKIAQSPSPPTSRTPSPPIVGGVPSPPHPASLPLFRMVSSKSARFKASPSSFGSEEGFIAITKRVQRDDSMLPKLTYGSL